MGIELFEKLGLSHQSLKQIEKKGFEEPTEIQCKTIPLLLTTTHDIIGQAQTGTGKTAAFGLPILELIDDSSTSIQVLILAPTRELATQISEELNSFKGKRDHNIVPIYGGQSMEEQIRRLKKSVAIVVGTPGRILDHIKRKTIKLNNVRFVVLDEADEMLNMGFIDDVEAIISKTPQEKRTLLFSATMPDHIQALAQKYMHEYKLVNTKLGKLTGELTDQIYFEVSQADKFESLSRILDIEETFYGMIFCRTRNGVDELTSKLIARGYTAEGLHGDYSQSSREQKLNKFRKKIVNILVATDVAARGIDITDLTHVINYSLPQDPESYIHRIGRTGRAGKKGVAITFISPSEYRKLTAIKRLIKTDIRKEQVPAIDDIIETKKKRIARELQDIIETKQHKKHLSTALGLLGAYEPVEMLAALIHYSFQNTLDKSNYAKITEFKDQGVTLQGVTRLFVSQGAKDGLSPQKLVELIKKETKIKAGLINDITIKDSFSFVTVPFKEAEIIFRAFKKHKKNMPTFTKANRDKDSKKKDIKKKKQKKKK